MIASCRRANEARSNESVMFRVELLTKWSTCDVCERACSLFAKPKSHCFHSDHSSGEHAQVSNHAPDTNFNFSRALSLSLSLSLFDD